MTDTKGLKMAIMMAGVSHEEVAYRLGIARETLWKKMNNITEFKAREIMLLQDILHLSNEQRDAIFLAKKVINNQQGRHLEWTHFLLKRNWLKGGSAPSLPSTP